MTPWPRQSTHKPLIATSLTAAAAVGSACFLAFVGLARPSHLQGRLSELRQKTEVADSLIARSRDADRYPKGTICSGLTSAAAAQIKQDLQANASRSGISLSQLEFTDGPRISGSQALNEIGVSFGATADYFKIATFLKSLSAERPTLFADRVDLNSAGFSVSLRFVGRAFCSAVPPR